MPYVTPTAADLKTRFPDFNAVGDDVIEAAILEAGTRVDEGWIEADYTLAKLLYSAHILSLEGFGLSGETETAEDTGLEQLTLGPLTLRFAKKRDEAGGSTDPLSQTPYGRRFKELLRRNSPGVMFV